MTMFKQHSKAMMIILIISLLFSCNNNSKVKIYVSWPGGEGLPHYQWEKGDLKPTGIEPAFIERVLEEAGLEYEYITDLALQKGGDPRMYSITTGRADICIRGMTINENRKRFVLFTNPYYVDGLSALVRKSDSLKTQEDLVGKNVYALEFTTAYPWAISNMPNSTVMTYSEFDTAFVKPESLLLKNEIDAYIMDKSFLNYIEQFNPSLEVMERKFTEESIGIAVSKNRPELVEKLNTAMEKLKESGEFNKLLKGLL
ncbi:ABC transporter substrate-binding protein [Flavobacteriales bacterium]|nr:ABC transporter substrate-binding protein [Flavobacteriales bacterium]